MSEKPESRPDPSVDAEARNPSEPELDLEGPNESAPGHAPPVEEGEDAGEREGAPPGTE